MNIFAAMNSSTGRVTGIDSPSVILDSYVNSSNGSTPYFYFAFKPSLTQQAITKQPLEWWGYIKSKTAPYSRLGNEAFMGDTYTTNYTQAPQVNSLNFGFSVSVGVTYDFVVYGKLNGVKQNEGSVPITAMTLPSNIGTITASGGYQSVSASWSAVNAGGDPSPYYYYFIYKSDFSRTFSGTTTATFITRNSSTYTAGTYYVEVTACNTVGCSIYNTSSGVSVSAPTNVGKICNSFYRSQGYCPTIGCCSTGTPGGTTCSPTTCY